MMVILSIFSMGEYGEFIWPSYIISLAALAILGFTSWRWKRTLEARLKNLEAASHKKTGK